MVLVAAQLSVLGSYLPPVSNGTPRGTAAPDDHFTAGPHCCVISFGQRALRSWLSMSKCPCPGHICRRCPYR